MSALTASSPTVTAPGAVGVPGTVAAPGAVALEEALALVAADPAAQALADTAALALVEAAAPEVVMDSPLADWLYGAWWTGLTGPAAAVEGPSGADDGAPADGAFGDGALAGGTRGDGTRGDAPLDGVLEAARRSAAGIERGWLVLAVDGARLVCARVRPSAKGSNSPVQRRTDAVVGSSRPGCPPCPGDLVDLLAGSGGPDADGNWWWAYTVEPPTGAVDRWYVNGRVEGAPALVAATVEAATTAGVAVSMKYPLRPSGFGRRDGIVAYVPRVARAAWEAALPGWLDAVAPWIAGEAPPLTRAVAPGVGFAEDPGGEVSLGQLRCAQMAAAVVQARRGPGYKAEEILAAVGIKPDRPELL